MIKEMWDVVIIGGGPAGMTAAIMCASRHLKTLILEGGKWGGLPSTLYPNKIIPNYPGFPEGISGIELVRKWLRHIKGNEFVAMKNERVIDIRKNMNVITDENVYHGNAIVIATGTRPRELGIPGESKYNKQGRGIYYYVTHKEEFIGEKTLIVGGGDTAVDAALDLIDLSDEIYIIHRRDKFRAMEENVKKMVESNKITIYYNTELDNISGEKKVEKVRLLNTKTKEKNTIDVGKIVIATGLKPNIEIFNKLGVQTDEKGFIVTDSSQSTSIRGVFAVGDIVKGSYRLLVVGAAHGAIVSQKIYEYVKKPYWIKKNKK
jgi:thioredoxin reductase (NADPH)